MKSRGLPRQRGPPLRPQESLQQNKVVDWLVNQRYADPGEEAYVERRDLGVRRVEVSNSGSESVMVKITTDSRTVLRPSELTFPVHYANDPRQPIGQNYVRPNGDQFPGVSFTLAPGEARFIGLNPYDGPMQYFHILDPDTGEAIGQQIEARHNACNYVLREGLQGWFFHAFGSTGFSAK